MGLLGLLANIIAAPVALPVKGLLFVADKIQEQASSEMLDDGKIRQQLLELQMLLDVGGITEEEFYRTEEELLDRLDAIVAHREEQAEGE